MFTHTCLACGTSFTARRRKAKYCRMQCRLYFGDERARLERLTKRSDGTNACWLWLGRLDKDGYGMLRRTRGAAERVHRIAYEIYVGPIPDGLCVCHTCDVRNCVRPSHLWLGTTLQNTQDKMAKGRHSCNRSITEAKARKIKDALNAAPCGPSGKIVNGGAIAIARRFRVSLRLVENIRGGASWRHV